METPELETNLGPRDFGDMNEYNEYCVEVANQMYHDRYGEDIQDALEPDTFLSRGFN